MYFLLQLVFFWVESIQTSEFLFKFIHLYFILLYILFLFLLFLFLNFRLWFIFVYFFLNPLCSFSTFYVLLIFLGYQQNNPLIKTPLILDPSIQLIKTSRCVSWPSPSLTSSPCSPTTTFLLEVCHNLLEPTLKKSGETPGTSPRDKRYLSIFRIEFFPCNKVILSFPNAKIRSTTVPVELFVANHPPSLHSLHLHDKGVIFRGTKGSCLFEKVLFWVMRN